MPTGLGSRDGGDGLAGLIGDRRGRGRRCVGAESRRLVGVDGQRSVEALQRHAVDLTRGSLRHVALQDIAAHGFRGACHWFAVSPAAGTREHNLIALSEHNIRHA